MREICDISMRFQSCSKGASICRSADERAVSQSLLKSAKTGDEVRIRPEYFTFHYPMVISTSARSLQVLIDMTLSTGSLPVFCSACHGAAFAINAHVVYYMHAFRGQLNVINDQLCNSLIPVKIDNATVMIAVPRELP